MNDEALNIPLTRGWFFDADRGGVFKPGGFLSPPAKTNILACEWINALRAAVLPMWNDLQPARKHEILHALQAWSGERKQLTTGQLLGTVGGKK